MEVVGSWVWLYPNPTCTNLESIQTSTQIFSHQSDFFRYFYVDFLCEKKLNLPENLKNEFLRVCSCLSSFT